jgi:L-threonylcarbamoyladenylate synthase
LKRIVVDPHYPRHEVISRAAGVLRQGGIVAFPTETFYGLAADAMDEAACARVFRVKGRGFDKALPCILSSSSQLALVTDESSPLVLRLAERFWPGPLTLVVPARRGVAAQASNGTVAVRVAGLALARQLAEALGRPVTSTSANLAGDTPPKRAEDVMRVFDEEVDLVLDGGVSGTRESSTIVDTTCDPPALIRRGAIDYALVLGVSSGTAD